MEQSGKKLEILIKIPATFEHVATDGAKNRM